MKRAIYLSWVLLITSTLLPAKDWNNPQAQEHRKMECEKMALEMHRSALEIEQRASKTEDMESSKLMSELAALKMKESENFAELAEAIRKKQWTSVKRLEKKGNELCHDASMKWKKLEIKEMQAKAKPSSNELKKPHTYSATKPHTADEKHVSEKPFGDNPVYLHSPKVTPTERPVQSAEPAASPAAVVN